MMLIEAHIENIRDGHRVGVIIHKIEEFGRVTRQLALFGIDNLARNTGVVVPNHQSEIFHIGVVLHMVEPHAHTAQRVGDFQLIAHGQVYLRFGYRRDDRITGFGGTVIVCVIVVKLLIEAACIVHMALVAGATRHLEHMGNHHFSTIQLILRDSELYRRMGVRFVCVPSPYVIGISILVIALILTYFSIPFFLYGIRIVGIFHRVGDVGEAVVERLAHIGGTELTPRHSLISDQQRIDRLNKSHIIGINI